MYLHCEVNKLSETLRRKARHRFRMLHRLWDFTDNLLLLYGQRHSQGQRFFLSHIHHNLKDTVALQRTASAKVVKRWQNSKWHILQIDFPRSVRKGNAYTLHLVPLTHHRNEGKESWQKQPKLLQDKKTEAVLLHYSIKLFCSFVLSRWIFTKRGGKNQKTLSHHFISVQVSTVSLSFWFHMLLCKKELHTSATEDSSKFVSFICTSPVQSTAAANFSWFFPPVHMKPRDLAVWNLLPWKGKWDSKYEYGNLFPLMHPPY